MELDCYQIIGVPRSAKHAEIRAAYYAAAKLAHPDAGRAGDGTSDNRTRDQINLNAAWAILGDPQRRAAYDAELRLAEAGGEEGDTATRAAGAALTSPVPASAQAESVGRTTASDEIAEIMAERRRALNDLRRQRRIERDANRCRKTHREPLELRADDDLATKLRLIARWLRVDRHGQRVALAAVAVMIFLVIPTIGQLSITGDLVAVQFASLGAFALAQSVAALRLCHTPLGDTGLASLLNR